MAAHKKNTIVEKSENFALRIIRFYSYLQTRNEYVISKQLLRSGTSIGANVSEGIAAESRADFVHKLNLALKEAHETLYWIRLIKKSRLVEADVNDLARECDEIIRILSKIIITTKSRSNTR